MRLSGRVRVLVYNTDDVDPATLPDSVLDLTDPAYSGKVAVAPANGSFQDFVSAMRVQQGDDAAAGEEKPYHIADDGTVDWATFSGYRRYNSVCNTCHGFDGTGSSFGPALVDSLKRLNHDQFTEIVVNGKTEVNTAVQKKMPSFGTDPNVMCYLDDIYAYLKGRSDGGIGGGRAGEMNASLAG